MKPRKSFAPVARKAPFEAPPTHDTEMIDISAAAGPQAQPASDQDTESRDHAGPGHRGHPNEEESASADPPTTLIVESDDSTGSNERFLRLTPTPQRIGTDSETSQEVSPGSSSPERLDLNTTPESLLEHRNLSDPMLADSPDEVVETLETLLDYTLLTYGVEYGRHISQAEGIKTKIETTMRRLRVEMDTTRSSIEDGRTDGRGFDDIERDLKQLVEAKCDIDEAIQVAEEEFRTGRVSLIGTIQALRRQLGQV